MPKNILIADDNAGVRALIRTYLEMQTEFEVCGEATDGVDAIEKIKELKPDLILLDLVMPKMNGAEVASIIKRTMPTVPIILFSVHGEKIGKSLASAVGVDIVLSKPDGISNLVESVKSLLHVA
ncbi:MAG TPA: response regulator transcription factor [Candidatus Binatus sp.]|jgi:DNA-binding NarL/FixJ family response regulator|nr:response regulator transcription factor [Candidatus Binatus sp.]